ncbi:hypothetical protein GCM10009415_30470 [Chitinophaga japonensis]
MGRIQKNVNLTQTRRIMNTIKIDNKSYVVVPKKEYENLLTKAAQKTTPAKKMSLNQGKKLAYKLIDKWAKEK